MDPKIYTFDEAILEPGLYRSSSSGHYIFVTKNSYAAERSKPCYNGVVFFRQEAIDGNLSDIEFSCQIQKCNVVMGQYFTKVEGSLDFRLFMNPDKVIKEG